MEICRRKVRLSCAYGMSKRAAARNFNISSHLGLVGAILMEQTEDWTVQRSRYMTLETLAPVGYDPIVSLPAAQKG